MKPIRVLVIDDSALVREVLSQGLSQDPKIEVVGTAPDPYIARDQIIKLQPNVLTLDVEMPRMDGVQFLRYLMPSYPLPVIMVSALTGKGQKLTLDALEAGALDFVTKPGLDVARGLTRLLEEIREKIKIAATIDVSYWRNKAKSSSPPRVSQTLAVSTDKVIAIGASTGGVEAISGIIKQLPATTPGVVIVQHMPPGFTKTFADRLNDQCVVEVKEASTQDRVLPGRVLLAPGGEHMKVRRSGGQYLVQCASGPKVNSHCPSVEVLFNSVAQQVGANAIGVMLTGMGSDGADGMVAMRQAGARTLAQDEKTSVVFGMPYEAYKRGGAERLVSLNDIPSTIFGLLNSIQ